MKKTISCILSVILICTCFVTSAFAVDFVPSISAKPAPTFVSYGLSDTGRTIIGLIKDANGEEIGTAYPECLIITPVSEAETSTEIPADAKELLLAQYEYLCSGVSLSDVCAELDAFAKGELGESADASDLIVKDLFDITSLCETLDEFLAVDGNTLEVTLRTPVSDGQAVIVISYSKEENKWEPIVSTVNNNDGTITCTFEHLCPVAIIVPSDADEDPELPPTGDTNVTLWVFVMVASLGSIAVLAVSLKRRQSK